MDELKRQNSPAYISVSMDSDEKDIDEKAHKDRKLGRKIIIGYILSCLISVPTVCFLTHMLTPPSPILQVQINGFHSDVCTAEPVSSAVLSTTKRKKAACHNWEESLGRFQYKATSENVTMHKDGDYGICTLKAFERAGCAGRPFLEVPILLEHSQDCGTGAIVLHGVPSRARSTSQVHRSFAAIPRRLTEAPAFLARLGGKT